MSTARKHDYAALPDGWRMVKLGDVATLRNTQVIPSETDTRPYVALEHIAAGGNLISCAEASEAISNKTEFQCGDTLYGKLRPNLRKVVRVNFDGVCSTDILAIHGTDNIDHRYLGHVINGDRLHEHAMRGAAGTKMPRTSWNHLRKYHFYCPPLPEQRAIADVLDSIDEAIERTEAVIAATETLRDSLLHELLTRGVPGWHAHWKDVPGIGTIPADWEVVRLGEVVKVNSSNWDPSSGSTIQYLDLTAVTAPGVLSAPREIAAVDAPSRARRRVKAGDILVSTVRPNLRGFARVQQVPDNLVASTGFAMLTPRADIDGSYIYHHVMMQRFAQHLEKATTGQAYPAVRPSDVEGYRLPIPQQHEQEAIADLLDSVDEQVRRARAERETMASAKASLADALLTGRSRV